MSHSRSRSVSPEARSTPPRETEFLLFSRNQTDPPDHQVVICHLFIACQQAAPNLAQRFLISLDYVNPRCISELGHFVAVVVDQPAVRLTRVLRHQLVDWVRQCEEFEWVEILR